MKTTITLLVTTLTSTGLLIGSIFSTPACEEELLKAKQEIETLKKDFKNKAYEKQIAEEEARTLHNLVLERLNKMDSLTHVIDSLQSR